MKPTKIASLVALSIASSAAFADQTTELDTLVLSGGFTPVDEESYARSYTIVGEEDIEKGQETTVADVLRQVPGLHVSKYGGSGGQADIRVRGSESNHTLVLIDGIEVANSSSAYNFSFIGPENIERIEVLRGAQSAIYGAGATAAVINIITKTAEEIGTSSSISLELDSQGGHSISGEMQQRTDNGGLSLGISHREEDGWDSSNDTTNIKDGLRNTTFNVKADTVVSDSLDINFVARYTDRFNEYDETATNSTTNQGEGCGSLDCYVYEADNYKDGYDFYTKIEPNMDILNGKALFTPLITYSKSYSGTKQDAWGAPSYTRATTFSFAPQIAFSYGTEEKHNMVIATEIERETYEGSTATSGNLKERNSKGIALDYNSQLTDKMFLQAGARYDNNDKFDNAFSWAASTSYNLSQDTKLRASAGQGQTNPTFSEQFGWGGSFHGNLDLKPEKNTSWDIGISRDYANTGSSVSITYFDETLQDAITSSGSNANNATGKTKKSGIELAADINLTSQLNLGAGYTYLNGENPDGDKLVRRPEHSANIDLTYSLERTRLNLGVNHYGKNNQKDFSNSVNWVAPTVELEAYTLVDINVSYQLNQQTELYGSIKNLANTQYQEIIGYKGQPRTFYAGIKHSW